MIPVQTAIFEVGQWELQFGYAAKSICLWTFVFGDISTVRHRFHGRHKPYICQLFVYSLLLKLSCPRVSQIGNELHQPYPSLPQSIPILSIKRSARMFRGLGRDIPRMDDIMMFGSITCLIAALCRSWWFLTTLGSAVDQSIGLVIVQYHHFRRSLPGHWESPEGGILMWRWEGFAHNC